MPVKSILCAASVMLLIGSAWAQEPKPFPVPPPKPLPKNAAEEVRGRVVGRPAAPAPALAPFADAQFNGYPYSRSWHAGYHHPLWDRPLALVVPPVSHYQTIWGWGIGATQVTPIYPQYVGPGFGLPGDFPGDYRTPPYWPWDTRQLGVYYIRGPW
jgi:hypothetical protein